MRERVEHAWRKYSNVYVKYKHTTSQKETRTRKSIATLKNVSTREYF